MSPENSAKPWRSLENTKIPRACDKVDTQREEGEKTKMGKDKILNSTNKIEQQGERKQSEKQGRPRQAGLDADADMTTIGRTRCRRRHGVPKATGGNIDCHAVLLFILHFFFSSSPLLSRRFLPAAIPWASRGHRCRPSPLPPPRYVPSLSSPIPGRVASPPKMSGDKSSKAKRALSRV